MKWKLAVGALVLIASCTELSNVDLASPPPGGSALLTTIASSIRTTPDRSQGRADLIPTPFVCVTTTDCLGVAELLYQFYVLPYLDASGLIAPAPGELVQSNAGSEGSPVERFTFSVMLDLDPTGSGVPTPTLVRGASMQMAFAPTGNPNEYIVKNITWHGFPTSLTPNPRTVALPATTSQGAADCLTSIWSHHHITSGLNATAESERIIGRDELGQWFSGVLVNSMTDQSHLFPMGWSLQDGDNPSPYRACIARFAGTSGTHGPWSIEAWSERGLHSDNIWGQSTLKNTAYDTPIDRVSSGLTVREREAGTTAVIQQQFAQLISTEALPTSAYEWTADTYNMLLMDPQNCHAGRPQRAPVDPALMGLTRRSFPNPNASILAACGRDNGSIVIPPSDPLSCDNLAACGWQGPTPLAYSNENYKGSSTFHYAARCLQLPGCYFQLDASGGNSVVRCLEKQVPTCDPVQQCRDASGTGTFACNNSTGEYVGTPPAALADVGYGAFFNTVPGASAQPWEKERTRRAQAQVADVIGRMASALWNPVFGGVRGIGGIFNPINQFNIILNDSSDLARYDNRSNTVIMGTNTFNDWPAGRSRQRSGAGFAFNDFSNNPGVLAHEIGHALHETAFGGNNSLFDNMLSRADGHFLTGIAEGFADFIAYASVNKEFDTHLVKQALPIEYNYERLSGGATGVPTVCTAGTVGLRPGPGALAATGCEVCDGTNCAMLAPYECVGGNTCKAMPCSVTSDCNQPGDSWGSHVECADTDPDPVTEDKRCVTFGRMMDYPRTVHGSNSVSWTNPLTGASQSVNSCLADFDQFNGPSCQQWGSLAACEQNSMGQPAQPSDPNWGCGWVTPSTGSAFCTSLCNEPNYLSVGIGAKRVACGNVGPLCSWDPVSEHPNNPGAPGQCYYKPNTLWYCIGTTIANAMHIAAEQVAGPNPPSGNIWNAKTTMARILTEAVLQQPLTLDELVVAIFAADDDLNGTTSPGTPNCTALHAGLSAVNLHDMTDHIRHAGYPSFQAAPTNWPNYYPYPGGLLPGSSTSCDE